MLCLEQRQNLKTCFSSSHFIQRMMGKCDEVQADFENCIDKETQKRMEQNRHESKIRTEKWMESNKQLGIK
jgi:Cytochrome c oxidase biogenesis protein Cmc1 like